MPSSALVPVLFATGWAALVLEVAWTRAALLVFGSTTLAATVVLSTFMAGLALGSAWIGPRLRSIRRPGRVLAFAFFLTAGCSFAIAAAGRVWGFSSELPRGLVIVGLLLPTLAMGTTIPLAIAMTRANPAWLYGVNTLGGASGALAASFWWLPAYGLFVTQLISGVLFLMGGGITWFLRGSERNEVKIEGTLDRRFNEWGIGGLAAWAGASALALELVWTRLLSLILGPSVYALGLVLFVYLSGIALGAFFAPAAIRRFGARRTAPLVLAILGASVALSATMFSVLPYLFIWVVELFRPAPGRLHAIEFLLSASAIGLPAFLHGLFLPSLFLTESSTVIPGRREAAILAANTLGAIVGSALTGLWAIPRFGFMPILCAVLLVDLLLGTAILLRDVQLASRALRGALGFLVALFALVFLFRSQDLLDRAVLASGVYKYAVGDALKGEPVKIEVGEIRYYREGVSSTVAVIATANDLVLTVDGKADASVHGDRSTEVLLAALPLSLADRTERTLVIGFASGITAGVASLFEGTKVTAVDIEPAVYEAAAFFESVNQGPLLPPRHSTIVGDGRHFLATTAERFDVITSEPSNPWMSGVAPLFTREFFLLARSRLAPGGVFCQWLPIYGMSSNLVASVLRTFADVMPYVHVFESSDGYDLLLIGRQESMPLDARAIEKRWTNTRLRSELDRIGIRDGLDLVARFFMGPVGIEKFAANAVVNTDDNGYLEFGAPRSLHWKTAQENDRLLSAATEGLLPYLDPKWSSPARRSELAERYEARGEGKMARSVQP